MVSVVTLAERKWQHTHVRNDVECIQLEGVRLTVSTQTERCWLITYIQMGKHLHIQKDDVCSQAWRKKLTACKRWKRCSMHPSEQREVNCITTNRGLLFVFVIAQRNTQHAHIRIDIEYINIHRERITESTHTERWWLMSHLQKKNYSIHTWGMIFEHMQLE